MIGIIDYGMGNLFSVSKALERLGSEAAIVHSASEINRVQKLILPGVGAFGDAMAELNRRSLSEPIRKAISENKPFLGVCLGLQLLFESSNEGGQFQGLGVLKGQVTKFTLNGKSGPGARLKVPHMGWNQVSIKQKNSPLLKGIPDESYFYFVHSYYAVPAEEKIIAGCTQYGGAFASIISKDRLFACQFHPEKSHEAGFGILKNFVEVA